MLTSIPFYFGTTRNLVVAFCGLFSNIFIRNRDTAGVSKKIVNVPIAYVQKEKFLVRLMQDPGLNEDSQINLPRLSAEIVGIDYDQTRQLNKVHKNVGSTVERVVYSYSPVPYNLTFNLYSYTRNVEDNLQIMEQILPFFTPDMNLTIKMMKEPALTQDIPLLLNSVSTDDQFDGSFEDTRTIITTYSFTMKAYFYGPILNHKDPENHFANGADAQVIKHVAVSVNAASKYSAVIDPFTANETDPYQVVENWSDSTPTLTDPKL